MKLKIEIRDIERTISDVHAFEHEYLRIIKRNKLKYKIDEFRKNYEKGTCLRFVFLETIDMLI